MAVIKASIVRVEIGFLDFAFENSENCGVLSFFIGMDVKHVWTIFMSGRLNAAFSNVYSRGLFQGVYIFVVVP
jgi:hypothetical protein